MITLQVRAEGYSRFRAPAAAPRTAGTCVVEIAAARRAAPASRAELLATGLTAPLSDGRRADGPALAAVEAERGFGLGSGYLTGQIIDRAI